MSEPIRIAVAVEGPTDAIVLRAILKALLRDMEFQFQTLQPEGSAAFGSAPFGKTGAGWAGVYRWCRQAVLEGDGAVSGSSALSNHDVLVVQVDADVAGEAYADGNIRDAPRDDLPCEEPCPPPDRTTNALRAVIVNWLGEREQPQRTVLCTPSKSMEAWVIAAVWPDNRVIRRGNWECHRRPEGQLAALPKAKRFAKRLYDYRQKEDEVESAWPRVSSTLTEAARFEREFLAAMHAPAQDGR